MSDAASTVGCDDCGREAGFHALGCWRNPDTAFCDFCRRPLAEHTRPCRKIPPLISPPPSLPPTAAPPTAAEAVNHPQHYNDHPSGVECIDIVEHMPFNIGNAIKYAWRAGIKATPQIEDLEKAKWYLEREIRRVQRPTVTFTAELRQRVRDFLYNLGGSK